MITSSVSVPELIRSPAWFPVSAAGADVIRLARLDEAAYRAASFLDERIFRSDAPRAACTAALLREAAASLAPAANYIFHIGHVGSTLLSRLVGEDRRLFSVREPALLRVVARALPCPMAPREILALLSRTWHPAQRAVIKATSFVSEISRMLMEATPGARSLLMYTPAITYLRSILGGPNSRVESRSLAPFRLARVRRRLAPASIPDPCSEGECIAMSWLCEMTSLCETAEAFGERARWVEFERFLADPHVGLSEAFAALAAAPDAAVIGAALSGPLMHQYSKAPEHAYDPALRRLVLESADREHGAEIRKGMQWLSGLTDRHPLITRALDLSAAR